MRSRWQVAATLLALSLVAWGCTATITPRIPVAQEASWDMNEQTSGFLGFDESGNGILTQMARDRYDDLVKRYGGRFSPPLSPGAGLSARGDGSTWLIDARHLEAFSAMTRWKRQER